MSKVEAQAKLKSVLSQLRSLSTLHRVEALNLERKQLEAFLANA